MNTTSAPTVSGKKKKRKTKKTKSYYHGCFARDIHYQITVKARSLEEATTMLQEKADKRDRELEVILKGKKYTCLDESELWAVDEEVIRG